MTPVPKNLPPEALNTYKRYLEQPLAPKDTLSKLVNDYVATLQNKSKTNEMVDLTLAKSIAASLLDLIEKQEGDELSHVQAAVHFFVENRDYIPDLESIAGFDDDAQVLNAVCEHLNRNDLEVV
jgi:uncharacterized membrane protein YkvA (DUF1232 family)